MQSRRKDSVQLMLSIEPRGATIMAVGQGGVVVSLGTEFVTCFRFAVGVVAIMLLFWDFLALQH